VHNDRGSAEMSYIRVYEIDGTTFESTKNQPIPVPGRRAGILTHPASLVAYSTHFDNNVVGRRHWKRLDGQRHFRRLRVRQEKPRSVAPPLRRAGELCP
jgi:hypothetical protein